MTFANMPARGLPFFYRGLGRAIPVLHASNGLIAGAGGPERLGRGAMTFTIWDSLEDALGFSYRRQPHRGLVKNVREEDRFIDSMFLRLAPYAIEGAWFPWSRFAAGVDALARAMPSVPAPCPRAATPSPQPSGSRQRHVRGPQVVAAEADVGGEGVAGRDELDHLAASGLTTVMPP